MATASAPPGIGAPVMILIASPAPRLTDRCGTRRELADHAQIDRHAGHVRGANRIAVDGGVVERWHHFGRDDRRCQHQPDGHVAVDLDGVEWRAGFEHERLSILQRGHARNVPQGSARSRHP